MAYDEREGMLKVHVHDTGKGIRQEDIPKLFSLFGKLRRTAELNHEGIGMGLMICQNLVRMNHGTIEVHSDGENQGSVFSFSMKMSLPDAHTRGNPAEATQVKRLKKGAKDRPETEKRNRKRKHDKQADPKSKKEKAARKNAPEEKECEERLLNASASMEFSTVKKRNNDSINDLMLDLDINNSVFKDLGLAPELLEGVSVNQSSASDSASGSVFMSSKQSSDGENLIGP